MTVNKTEGKSRVIDEIKVQYQEDDRIVVQRVTKRSLGICKRHRARNRACGLLIRLWRRDLELFPAFTHNVRVVCTRGWTLHCIYVYRHAWLLLMYSGISRTNECFPVYVTRSRILDEPMPSSSTTFLLTFLSLPLTEIQPPAKFLRFIDDHISSSTVLLRH